MPVVDFEKYCAVLDHALKEHYALPAINVLEIDTLNAAIEGFVAARSDGIVEIGMDAGLHTSGPANDAVLGAITLAEHAHRVAETVDVNIAIHTDHCPSKYVDSFLLPLIEETRRRRTLGLPNLFQSHMFDGSDLPLDENLKRAKPLLEQCAANEIVLEVEAGVFGGDEEDGVSHAGPADEKLYTTPEDMVKTYEALSAVDGARFMLAATFGNVHGVYKPGTVVLKPEILKNGQDAVVAKYGEEARFWLVFHGGSGSELEDIHASMDYGVVKMNIHTDTQYAFTRAVADHMLRNYDHVLKVDGEVGVKVDYVTKTWLAKGKASMAERVVLACEELRSAGKSLAL